MREPDTLASPMNRSIGCRYNKRDRWRCGICGKKVNRGFRVPHPLAATLDHIVPMSLGGGHVRSNVHLAHFRCNTLKGNRGGGEQLALIG